MIRHNASIIASQDKRQSLAFYLRDTIKRAKGWATFEFLNFLRLSSMAGRSNKLSVRIRAENTGEDHRR